MARGRGGGRNRGGREEGWLLQIMKFEQKFSNMYW